MAKSNSSPYKDVLGAIAAAVMAIACLVAAVYHISILHQLERHGVRVEAVVVGFERGAKGSRWAIYQYRTLNDQQITARDLFLQYIKGVDKGQSLRVIYDARDASRVTADLGIWTWQAPAIFLFGFIFLFVLTILVWRHRQT